MKTKAVKPNLIFKRVSPDTRRLRLLLAKFDGEPHQLWDETAEAVVEWRVLPDPASPQKHRTIRHHSIRKGNLKKLK